MSDRPVRRLRAAVLAAAALAAIHAGAAAGQDPAAVQAVVSDYLRERASELPGTPEITVAADDIARQAACTAP